MCNKLSLCVGILFLSAVASQVFCSTIIVENKYKEPIKVAHIKPGKRDVPHILLAQNGKLVLKNFNTGKDEIWVVPESHMVLPRKMHYYGLKKLRLSRKGVKVFLVEIRDLLQKPIDYSVYQFKKTEEEKAKKMVKDILDKR